MTYPAARTFPTPSSKNTTTHEVIASGVHLIFEYPATWSVTGPPAQGRVNNAAGIEVATFDVVATWDANGPLPARPAVMFPATPGASPLSGTGEFIVRNAALDLSGYKEDLSLVRWPKPVRLVISSDETAGQNATTLVPCAMNGVVAVKQDTPSGRLERFIVFQSSKYFDTMEQARAYTQTEEYRQIQAMIASLHE